MWMCFVLQFLLQRYECWYADKKIDEDMVYAWQELHWLRHKNASSCVEQSGGQPQVHLSVKLPVPYLYMPVPVWSCQYVYVQFGVMRIAKQYTRIRVFRCSPHPGLLHPLPLLLVTTCMFWINRLIIPPAHIPLRVHDWANCHAAGTPQLQSALPAVYLVHLLQQWQNLSNFTHATRATLHSQQQQHMEHAVTLEHKQPENSNPTLTRLGHTLACHCKPKAWWQPQRACNIEFKTV